ncbi:hypothetical protein DEAC_c31600 [Desulfosporosinus acididurans]|uniref:Uncharacterized protein n=1 Tax=Desulfosporosinus acididurans TaxID=476652 RepID=A0A0J1FNB3_9FIRM|nr:HTH domain-containing protein [Desulfosporosinus acididurans]KLU64832.1 hypothetical protein DEAC_c31600 [Desulfosporosinus acididurans]
MNDMNITLQYLINEAFTKGAGKEIFGKNKKNREEAAEKLTAWFSSYYGGTHDEAAKENILSLSISLLKENKDEFTANISQGIRIYTRDKYPVVRRIEHLVKHLNSKYEFGLDLTFLEQLKARDGYDRLLKILKYLHSGSHTREELSKTFGISERALSDDLNTLKDGFKFMGTTMKISELERGQTRTVH